MKMRAATPITGRDKPALSDLGVTNTILGALEAGGYVIVPRVPTPEMLDAAYWSAAGEDAGGVWQDMIEAALAETDSPLQQREL